MSSTIETRPTVAPVPKTTKSRTRGSEISGSASVWLRNAQSLHRVAAGGEAVRELGLDVQALAGREQVGRARRRSASCRRETLRPRPRPR